METAVSTLSVLPSGKAEIRKFADMLATEIESGNNNPLDILKQFKAIEKVFEFVKPALSRAALSEAEKHGKSVDMRGVRFEIKEAGVKYDYSGCGDVVYNELMEKKQRLDKEIKKREKLLLGIDRKTILVDEDSGETYEVFPAAKKSTTIVQTTFL